MELHTAILLVNYEVDWSVTALTHEEMDAAVNDFAVREWRAAPEDYPAVADEAEVLADRAAVLDKLGVLITFATSIETATV